MSDGFDYHEPLTTEGVRKVFLWWVDEYYAYIPEAEILQKFDEWLDGIREAAYYNGYDNAREDFE